MELVDIHFLIAKHEVLFIMMPLSRFYRFSFKVLCIPPLFHSMEAAHISPHERFFEEPIFFLKKRILS